MRKHPIPFLSPLAGVGALVAIAAIAIAWVVSGGAVVMPGPLSRAGDGEVHGGARRHADLDCDACHAGLGGGTMSPRCLACHDDTRAEIDAGAPLHGRLPEVHACLHCHTEHTGGEITRVDRARFPHDATGFALTAHDQRKDGARFTCADCHDAGGWAFDRARCAGCHKDDAHDFLAGHVAAYGETCLACHDGVDRFGRGRFEHGKTRFALDGKHAPLACEACHRGAKDLAAFATAPVRCVGCHAKDDVHHGAHGDDCARCHATSGWKPAKDAGGVSSSTSPPPPTGEQAPPGHRFPLDHGGGGRVACAVCHPHGDDTYTCFGCHEHTPSNVARFHGPRGIDDTHDCAHCHPRGRR